MSSDNSIVNEASVVAAWVSAIDRGSVDELFRGIKGWTEVHTSLLQTELMAQYNETSLVGGPILSCNCNRILEALLKITSDDAVLHGAVPIIAGLYLLDDTL